MPTKCGNSLLRKHLFLQLFAVTFPFLVSTTALFIKIVSGQENKERAVDYVNLKCIEGFHL